MFKRIKKHFAIQKDYDFGEMMGEILCGLHNVDIHRYFLIKTEYIKARNKLPEFKVQPYQISTWIGIIGWDKKYPRIAEFDPNKFKEICDTDEFDLKAYEEIYKR